jgi:hypothetical protein
MNFHYSLLKAPDFRLGLRPAQGIDGGVGFLAGAEQDARPAGQLAHAQEGFGFARHK